MTLEEKINGDIKSAMLAKEAAKLEALRAIKSAILLLKTSAEGHTAESELKSLQKMVKQRRETAEVYKTQSRADLAETEEFQANIIEAYLPKMMSEDEIKTALTAIIAESGASSAAEMGKVMGLANKAFAGKKKKKCLQVSFNKLNNKKSLQ